MRANEAPMKRFIAAILMSVLLTACGAELSVEQQVIASLERMEEAAEEGRHLEFMGYVDESFSGQSGVLDRRGFHRFMLFQINENRRLRAQFFPIHVQASITSPDTSQVATRATAQFNILVTGGAGLLPERGQLFAVDTAWVRDGDDWLLSGANWQPVALQQ